MTLADSPADTFKALQASSNSDPQPWLQLAIDARTAGEPDLAADALAKAAEFGLPPVNVGFEKARQLVVRGDRQAALAELQTLVDGGFTAIAPITGDALLSTLAGDPVFDAMIRSMEVQAYPCAHQERFRAFDFWVGEWDVHLANGTLAGSNSIQPVERGCVLVENWATAGGGSGHSINYLDGASGEWVQVWNAAGGSQINIRGGMTEQGMRMTGQIHYLGNDTTFPFRALWTPLSDGRVRQYFEQSNDSGKTWSPWFEGFYTRRAAAEDAR
jgi:hypothetical protein